AQRIFLHYSDIRVGSLAFNPADGMLWGVAWPKNQNSVIEFVDHDVNPHPVPVNITPRLMFQFSTNVDSISFGLLWSLLAGFVFVSHDQEALPGGGPELTMIDLATRQSVAIASGGTRGDELKATQQGRLFLSQSHQVDVLDPVRAP